VATEADGTLHTSQSTLSMGNLMARAGGFDLGARKRSDEDLAAVVAQHPMFERYRVGNFQIRPIAPAQRLATPLLSPGNSQSNGCAGVGRGGTMIVLPTHSTTYQEPAGSREVLPSSRLNLRSLATKSSFTLGNWSRGKARLLLLSRACWWRMHRR